MSVKEINAHNNFRWHCGCEQEQRPASRRRERAPTRREQRRPKEEEEQAQNNHRRNTGIVICQVNVDGWRGRATVLHKYFEDQKVDMALLQETKMLETTPSVKMEGWRDHRQERTVHRVGNQQPQGGVAILTRENLDVQRLDKLSLPNQAALESIGVEVKTKKGRVKIWNMYRPPARGGNSYSRDVELYLSGWPSGKDVIIGGDVNAHGVWDHSGQTDQGGEEINDWMASKNMVALNNGAPTRYRGLQATAPDITIAHASRLHLIKWEIGDSLESDHLPFLVKFATAEPVKEKAERRNFNYKRADWEGFAEKVDDLVEETWKEEGSLEKRYKDFVDIVMKAAKAKIPMTSSRKRQTPWWNEECNMAKERMKESFDEWKRTKEERAWTAYETAKRNLSRAVAEGKRDWWRSFAPTLDAHASGTKIWNTIKGIDGRSKQPLPANQIISGNCTARSNNEKADLAMKTYAQVSRVQVDRVKSKTAYTDVREHLKEEPEECDDTGIEFSPSELYKVLSKTKNSAAGEDRVMSQMLKHFSYSGQELLLKILNRSWVESRVPAKWKQAVIVPIRKPKKPADAIKSYRPASLLSCVSKALEALVTNRLKKWVRTNNIIPVEQSGFQSRRTTQDVLANITQSAMDNLQAKKRTIVAAVDFRAAFDTVWRGGLLRDMARLNLHPVAVKSLQSFLRDRRAVVRWEDKTSRCRILKEGEQRQVYPALSRQWLLALR